MDYALSYTALYQFGRNIMHSSSDRSRGPLDAFEFVKCVVVGDTSVGKTRLICSYVYDEPGRDLSTLCHKHHVPTVFAIDQYASDTRIRGRAKVSLNGLQAQLRIWDTFGDHSKNRKFAYQNANVVVLCFSIGLASSLRNVNAKWYPEIMKYCPRAPIVLVGTQFDRRHTDVNAFKSFKVTTLTDVLNNNLSNRMQSETYVNKINKCTTPDAGRQAGREINAAVYLEASIVTKYGVNEVFENAIRAAYINRRLSRPLFNSSLKFIKKPMIQEPFLPEKSKQPALNLDKPEFTIDFSELLVDDSSCDITFLVQHELIKAHCVVLLIGSPVFFSLLTHPKVLSRLGYNPLPLQNSSTISMSKSKINGILTDGTSPGIETVDLLCELEEKCKVFVKISDVFPTDFRSIIEFIYTGKISNAENPVRLLQATRFLQMDTISKYVSNLISNQDVSINRQVKNELNTYRLHQMSQYLHKQDMYADIAFLVDNTVIPSHKNILMNSCPMMAGMFRHSSFKENVTRNVDFRDTNLESFLAVLEYLYTGDCKYYGDLHGTLQLANFLCLPRLVALCEEEIVRYITELHEKNDKEVYGAVIASYSVAKFYNAPQLSDWCLHFMATNYNDLCKEQGKEIKTSLDEKTLKYLEEHRWPPVWYLKEQDYYDRTMKQYEHERSLKKKRKGEKKCKICF